MGSWEWGIGTRDPPIPYPLSLIPYPYELPAAAAVRSAARGCLPLLHPLGLLRVCLLQTLCLLLVLLFHLLGSFGRSLLPC